MLKVDRLEVMGMPNALWFMRMPFESFEKSDTKIVPGAGVAIGPKDLELSKRLIQAGPEHCKFLRDIHVQMQVTAPRYWWAEFDTYHFAVQNSSSTMHLISKRPLTRDDFEHEGEDESELEFLDSTIRYLNMLISLCNDKLVCDTYEKKRVIMVRIKRHLPESFLQMRGLDFNYKTAYDIICQRSMHALPIWRSFCKMLLENLPYAKDWFMGDNSGSPSP